MAKPKSHPLPIVKVASPCPADWDAMYGDDRVRFCGQCSLNVYNLSGMTRQEAERIIAAKEGRLCVRFYRRSDGTILTSDCPVGLEAVRRRARRIAGAAASFALSLLAGCGLTIALRDDASQASAGSSVVRWLTSWHEPTVTMGDMVAPEMGKPVAHQPEPSCGRGDREGWTTGVAAAPPLPPARHTHRR